MDFSNLGKPRKMRTYIKTPDGELLDSGYVSTDGLPSLSGWPYEEGTSVSTVDQLDAAPSGARLKGLGGHATKNGDGTWRFLYTNGPHYSAAEIMKLVASH